VHCSQADLPFGQLAQFCEVVTGRMGESAKGTARGYKPCCHSVLVAVCILHSSSMPTFAFERHWLIAPIHAYHVMLHVMCT
jgi:hypothetical protein